MKNVTRRRKSKSIPVPVYSETDFNSGDGMLTSVWGPSMWHFLHTMSFNYPVEPTQQEKNKYQCFVLSLQYVLPCKYCRMNFKKNLKQLPLTQSFLKSRGTFSKYMYDMHELVNKMLGKKSNLTYEEVRERYEHFRSRCTADADKMKGDYVKTTTTKRSNRSTTKRKKEKGCTEPLYGKKSKCLIKIVPQDDSSPTFEMDKKCVKTRRSRT